MHSEIAYRNLLEPPALTDLFQRHPPKGFSPMVDGSGTPVFFTSFDLLTTLEPPLAARVKKAPLFGLWSRLLRFPACFVGTTVTEYAPLPRNASPELLVDALLQEHGTTQSLTIIKDLPSASPLLSKEDNIFAEQVAKAAENRGFITVEGQALAYVLINFSSVDEYLARLSSSRRKDLRRKMKTRASLTIETVPLGDARFSDVNLLQKMYAMYLEVFNQSEIHFDLLTPEFFAALLQNGEGVVVFYRHGQTLAGYNICIIHNNMLVDKYIGFTYPLVRELNLYFISWMVNLELALERGLSTYIAGWTDAGVKAGLGASFTFTRHLVWVRNPVLRRILYPLRHLFEADAKALAGTL